MRKHHSDIPASKPDTSPEAMDEEDEVSIEGVKDLKAALKKRLKATHHVARKVARRKKR